MATIDTSDSDQEGKAIQDVRQEVVEELKIKLETVQPNQPGVGWNHGREAGPFPANVTPASEEISLSPSAPASADAEVNEFQHEGFSARTPSQNSWSNCNSPLKA